MKGFFGLPAELMSALGTVLGFALLGRLDYNQQNTLGNWLELIGQVLETNAAQGQLLQARAQGDRLEALEGELAALRQQVAALRQGSTEPTVASDSGGEVKTSPVLSPTAAADSTLAKNTPASGREEGCSRTSR
ncbi:MAG: hypothetical protein IKU58_03345 [Clostridia bacterium]|nr:hypothetical protein [Clostridia bacterium]